jgi:hypothetical protein
MLLFLYSSLGWFAAGSMFILLSAARSKCVKLQKVNAALEKKSASLEEHFALVNAKLKSLPVATPPPVVDNVSDYKGNETDAVTPPASDPEEIKVFTEVRHKTSKRIMTVLGFRNGKAECAWNLPDGKIKQDFFEKSELENIKP